MPAGVPETLTYSFTAVSASTSLTFMDISGFDSNAGWIDNVGIEVVPEPTTTMIFGVLLVPFGARMLRALRKNRVA
jgi:hypothetical protein